MRFLEFLSLHIYYHQYINYMSMRQLEYCFNVVMTLKHLKWYPRTSWIVTRNF